MQFFSTRDTNRKVTSSEAIAQGLSDEGGLFVPESFPQVDVRALCELDYPALAAAVIREYLTDYSPEFLAQAACTTYGEAFGGKAGYLAPVEGDTYALELWHGPTCAFKDYALQLMPRLLVEAQKESEPHRKDPDPGGYQRRHRQGRVGWFRGRRGHRHHRVLSGRQG